MSQLRVMENGSDRVVELTQAVVEIGRGSENQVVIQDPRSSRRHCRVSRTPQGWVLEDLKSRNGTTLNGAEVERKFLKPGDEFRIGNTRFVFSEAPAGAEPEAEPEVGAEAKTEPGPKEATEETRAGEFYLEGTEGAYFGKRIPIPRLPFTIGRKSDNDFHLDDARASGHHARIVERGGRYYLEDLDSTNGTLLNHKRVQKAPLAQGSLVKLGDSTFRVELPAGSSPPPATTLQPADLPAAPLPAGAGDAGFDTGADMVAADDFARLDARQFLSGQERGAAPLQVAALLLVLGTVLYFAVDVTRKMVRRNDPDPSPEGNVVQNWSFEEDGEGKAIPGWAIAEGDRGTLARAAEGAQFPGRNALHLTPEGDGLCRVAGSADFPVDPEAEYRIAAQVLNLGSFAAGVMVSWLKESEGRRVEVGRDWGTGVREGTSGQNVERRLRPPPLAVFARVMPYVIAAGPARGPAAFDQVSFSALSAPPAEEGSAGAEAPEEGDEEPVLPFDLVESAPEPPAGSGPSSRGLPVELRVQPAGSISEVRRGKRAVVQSLWVGLPGEADPLALGPRLFTMPRQASAREGVLLSSQVPDLKNGQWFSMETRVHGQGGEVQCEFRPGKSREGAAVERMAVHLEPGTAVQPLTITAFGGDLAAPAAFRPDRPVAGPIDELILGEGPEQLAIFFQPAVTLSARPHPEAHGRTLITAEASLGGRTLQVRISAYSRRENEAVAALLATAADLHRLGKPREARARLSELRSRFPWRLADLARAAAVEKGWNEEAERALWELASGLEDLERSPSPVIRDALLLRVESFLKRFEGSPSREGIESVAARVRDLVPAQEGRKEGLDQQALIEKSKLYLEAGQLGFADLCLRLAQESRLDPAQLERARHLRTILGERRAQRLASEGRTGGAVGGGAAGGGAVEEKR